MDWKKRLLKKSRLYIIIDKEAAGKTPLTAIARAIKPGVSIVQYRDKNSRKREILKNAYWLSKLLRQKRTLFIINDYIDVAKITASDGLHIGQGDLSIETARRILGKDKIIGVSCHSLNQAKDAQARGADYLGIGPVFSTPIKPGHRPISPRELKKIRDNISIPFFAVGGINRGNCRSVIAAGAKRIAVCRDICQGKSPADRIREFQKLIKQ